MQLRLKVREFHELKAREAVSEALFSLSTQVAHDIRSPLSVLETVAGKASRAIGGEDRAIMREAIARLNGIADDLLVRYLVERRAGRNEGAAASNPLGRAVAPQPLAPLVDAMVREKRVERGSRAGLAIDWRPEESEAGIIACVDANDFKRVLSNLMNNAIEALPAGKGLVRVRLNEEGRFAAVSISDNGRGLPAKALASIAVVGGSFGKPGGVGLGLSHARECARRWGGSLRIESEPSVGTTVRLVIPRSVQPPAPQALDAVLIDDDELVRRVWHGSAAELGMRLLAFERPEDFFAVAARIDRRSPLYVDRELSGGHRGENIARRALALGFSTVYLQTGFLKTSSLDVPGLAGVVGKSPPWGARRPASADQVSAGGAL